MSEKTPASLSLPMSRLSVSLCSISDANTNTTNIDKNVLSLSHQPKNRLFTLLLPLSLCAFLLGCDSQSSIESAPDALANGAATSDSMDKDRVSSQDDAEQVGSANIEANDESAEEEGQSLMAITQTSDAVQARRSPMFAAKRDKDSALDATLIGDYTGIFPCDSCDGIALTLNLISDGSVLKTSIYKNPASPRAPLVESGVYRQDDNVITIVYADKTIDMYQIEDNHLLKMDANKEPNADWTLSRK